MTEEEKKSAKKKKKKRKSSVERSKKREEEAEQQQDPSDDKADEKKAIETEESKKSSPKKKKRKSSVEPSKKRKEEAEQQQDPSDNKADEKKANKTGEFRELVGEEVKVYVGNLDYASNEDRLRKEFSQFGKVADVFLPVVKGSGRPRGFGFITFSSLKSANKAVSKMDQTQLNGRTIVVNISKPREPGDRKRGDKGDVNSANKADVKMYVGNLAFDTPEEEVRKLFETHGTVVDCFLPTDRATGKVRGFAFVTMSASEAEEACTKLNGYEMDGRELRVNVAQPMGKSKGPAMR